MSLLEKLNSELFEKGRMSNSLIMKMLMRIKGSKLHISTTIMLLIAPLSIKIYLNHCYQFIEIILAIFNKTL